MKLLTEFRQEMFEQIKYIVNGFPANDGANAAKAQSMYIKKHGKKSFL